MQSELNAADCGGLEKGSCRGPGVTLKLLQESSTALHYAGTWKTVTAKDASGDHV